MHLDLQLDVFLAWHARRLYMRTFLDMPGDTSCGALLTASLRNTG